MRDYLAGENSGEAGGRKEWQEGQRRGDPWEGASLSWSVVPIV